LKAAIANKFSSEHLEEGEAALKEISDCDSFNEWKDEDN
jgi:hypothetical protein